ncbi:NUDIX hydrolase [Gordonia crocea]|uniref:NUDIX hydrolase n=1 Tax=Gordonia crocea TaxID=589162 RepID=A0A7I9UZP5_9ACTN|nr:NUDIX domain-containing protein [Gordonia crocea]GED98349.1 NUDIX hydrolase [Gordonia crocea]
MTENAAPAPLRDASTVVLVRDGADGIDVFLQRRVKQMAFAGGMTVFPGGGVDERDADADLAWVGPDAQWWADSFSTSVTGAQELVCAAVRETFEECGVLLVTHLDGAAPDVAGLMPARAKLESRELSLAQFLRDNDLALRADLLRPLAHWITPKIEKRRYDTRFFLAELPAGQDADAETSEVETAQWYSASAALVDWSAGKHFLLPPTWTQLRELAAYDTVEALFAAQREIKPIEPGTPNDDFEGLRFAHADEYFASMNDQARELFFRGASG